MAEPRRRRRRDRRVRPPIGPGNVRNLELALEVAAAGTPVVLMDAVPIAERDFTGGRATELVDELRSHAVAVGSYAEAVDAVLARSPAPLARQVRLSTDVVRLADPPADLVVQLGLVAEDELVHPVVLPEAPPSRNASTRPVVSARSRRRVRPSGDPPHPRTGRAP